jgi:hypothetical protein
MVDGVSQSTERGDVRRRARARGAFASRRRARSRSEMRRQLETRSPGRSASLLRPGRSACASSARSQRRSPEFARAVETGSRRSRSTCLAGSSTTRKAPGSSSGSASCPSTT